MTVSSRCPCSWTAVLLLVGLGWGGGLPGIAQPLPKADAWLDAPFDSRFLPPDADAHRETGTNVLDASRRVVLLTNEEREARERTSLTATPALNRIACRHNKDMLAHSYSGHEDSDGRRVGDRLAREHRTMLATGYGENVFRAWGKTAQRGNRASTAVDSWMNSPPHRKNILRRSYTHLGACVTKAGDELRATQVFATIVGWLDTPLPWVLSRADSIATTVRAAASTIQFRRYAFSRVDQRKAFDFDQTVPLQNRLLIPGASGRYELRMAHVDAQGNPRTFHFSSGPRIEVAAPSGGM